MYEMLGICLSLAGVLVLTSLASALAVVLWRLSSRAAETWKASTRAQFLFLLRIGPSLAALLCVGGIFIPAYLANEPRHTGEIVTAKLGLVAAVSLYGIGCTLWRACATYIATRRLVRDWMRHAEPVRIEEVAIPVFRLRHQFPLIAIVGVWRPKLFIADQIFCSLNGEEISAAIAHEEAHLGAWDNVKRGLLRACRNYLTAVPLGRCLDRAWFGAAELAADEHAARSGPSVALDLASALVKVARLVPRGSSPVMLAGAALIAQDSGNIRSRVLRLTHLAAHPNCLTRTGNHGPNLAIGAGLSGLLLAAVLMVSSPSFLAAIHAVMECVVSALQ